MKYDIVVQYGKAEGCAAQYWGTALNWHNRIKPGDSPLCLSFVSRLLLMYVLYTVQYPLFCSRFPRSEQHCLSFIEGNNTVLVYRILDTLKLSYP